MIIKIITRMIPNYIQLLIIVMDFKDLIIDFKKTRSKVNMSSTSYQNSISKEDDELLNSFVFEPVEIYNSISQFSLVKVKEKVNNNCTLNSEISKHTKFKNKEKTSSEIKITNAKYSIDDLSKSPFVSKTFYNWNFNINDTNISIELLHLVTQGKIKIWINNTLFTEINNSNEIYYQIIHYSTFRFDFLLQDDKKFALYINNLAFTDIDKSECIEEISANNCELNLNSDSQPNCNILEDKRIACKNRFYLLDGYDKDQEELFCNMYQNLNKYKTKNTKVNLEVLIDTAIKVPKSIRTYKIITDVYNSKNEYKPLSLNRVHFILSNKFKFKKLKSNFKSKAFFCKETKESIGLFIYRILEDLNNGSEILFFDEYGIQNYNNKNYLLIHPSEDSHAIGKKSYMKMNILLITSVRKILYYEITKESVDTEIVTMFFKRFLTLFQSSWYINKTIVADNASYHSKEQLSKVLKKRIRRLVFISPVHPELNMIEFVINEVKKKTLSLKDITG